MLPKQDHKIKTAMPAMALAIALALSPAPAYALEDLRPLIGELGIAGPQKEEASPMPEEYQLVLELYQEALGQEQTQEELESLGLCPLVSNLSEEDRRDFGFALHDVNQDGTPELFLGMPDPDIQTIYQLFTIEGGRLTLVFTAREMDSLFLCMDDTLLRKGYTSTFALYAILYTMSQNGYVSMHKGLLYVPELSHGPYFTILTEDLDTSKSIPMLEEDFLLRMESYETSIIPLEYQPLLDWRREAD